MIRGKQPPHRTARRSPHASPLPGNNIRRGFAFAFARAAASGAGMRRAGIYKDKVGARGASKRVRVTYSVETRHRLK